VSFFDDDAEVAQAPSSRPADRPEHRTRDRSKLRRQRVLGLVVALAVLFLVVFALALIVRSCQQNAKESVYRTYFSGVQGDITDSATNVGKPIRALLANPTRLSRSELKAQLDKLVNAQAEITTRAEHIKPPGKLAQLHQVFVDGMRIRLRGVQLLRDDLLAALSGKHPQATARALAALSGYFSGPDVYYNELYKTQAQKIMNADGVTNVAVATLPGTVGYFAAHDLFSPSVISAALGKVSSSAKLTGTHGVGLASVDMKGSNQTVTLVSGKSNRFQATVGILVQVTVQNQGNVTETNVPVKVTWTPPSGAAQNLTASIGNLAAGAKQTVDVPGLQIQANDMLHPSHLRVQAGPVPNEKYLKNNVATYTIVPVLH
jgi:hypothetical protein